MYAITHCQTGPTYLRISISDRSRQKRDLFSQILNIIGKLYQIPRSQLPTDTK